MGQAMFTTNFLLFNNQQYNALWLRIDLEQFELSSSQKRLINQNSRFEVRVNTAEVSFEKENLYYRYREFLPFSVALSLQNLLTGASLFDIFDSRHIEIYDKESLVACGVFDLGENSAEGIVSIFDPEYKKYSLGKYLFLQKILFLKAAGYKYFYPGYFVPGYEMFDYKLEIAKQCTSFLDFGKGKWHSTAELENYTNPLALMEAKLKELNDLLLAALLKPELFSYNFFDIALVNGYSQYELLDLPMFLYCFPNSRLQEVIVIYNIFNDCFQLVVCNKPFQSNMADVEGHYTRFLLKVDSIIFEETDAGVFAQKLIELVRA